MSTLRSSILAPGDAPVMVLFGGNPHKRDHVLRMLETLGGLTAHGALSEEEGMHLLATLPRVDLVLIGGRYTEEQRVRIRAHVRAHLPGVPLTEPGVDYPYDDREMLADVRRKLGRAAAD
jgi:hypothetical protein